MSAAIHLIGVANAFWVSRSLHAVVMLNIADNVPASGISLDDLSCNCGISRDHLIALISVLKNHGVFKLDGDAVHHTPPSLLLRSDDPETLLDFVRWNGSTETWKSVERLPETLATGVPGFVLEYGQTLFEYLAKDAAVSRQFQRSMTSFTKNEIAKILSTVDFSGYQEIVELGGGTGQLAEAITEAFPESSVIVLDIASKSNDPEFRQNDRVTFVSADFFRESIPSCNLVIMMNVLHDWNDADVIRILQAADSSTRPGGAICVIDGVATERSERIDLASLAMRVMTGGRHRTIDEFCDLFNKVGYTIVSRTDCSLHTTVFFAERTGG